LYDADPVAVSARPANNVTEPARLGRRDVRGTSTVLAGTYPFEVGEGLITGWHCHDLHQLEYAFEGVAQVETSTARYLLPPQQAIWIPAGTEHCTTLTHVRTVSVFFDPALGLHAGDRVRVLAVAPVIREMLLHARRWPIDRSSTTPAVDRFFATLADLIIESLDQKELLWLPTSRHPLVDAAIEFMIDHQGEAMTIDDVCVAIGTSQRSLRRAFGSEIGMPWRQYLLQTRLLGAMALLAQPQPNVLAVAMAVGFDSVSGFTRAFRRYAGETPLAYRQRVLSPPAHPLDILSRPF
jgi:AraC-like DNA-binding protein/quercetin dioxygenase-like cupin family protein